MTALPAEPILPQATGDGATPYRPGAVGIWVGAAMLAALLVAGALVPLFGTHAPNDLVARPLQAPSAEHLFGTDQLGRDVFARVFSAVYRDLGVAFVGVLVPLVTGTLIGVLLANLRSAFLVGAMNTLVEAINALPLLVLAIALIAVFGPGLMSIVLILGLTNWARYARIAQTRAILVKQQGYLEAVRLLGYSRPRIYLRHFLPNVSSECLAYGLSDFILVIMLVAGLSFLSLGAAPPTAEWGVMMSEGRPFVRDAWWMTIFPGLALCWSGVSLSFIAEGFHQREQGI